FARKLLNSFEGLALSRSARTMQDGVGLALLHFLKQLTRFQCWLRNDLDADNEPLASPRNFFPDRQRRVAKLFAEFFGRSFLPFPYFAAVDHHIMRVALALDLDLAKSDQSCFHISMFCWLDKTPALMWVTRFLATTLRWGWKVF